MAAATATVEKKLYTLKSSGNEKFEVEEAVAMMSQTLKNIIEDGCSDDGIPLLNVTGKTILKVIEYCKKHVDCQKTDADGGRRCSAGAHGEEVEKWDKQFVKVDTDTLYDMFMVIFCFIPVFPFFVPMYFEIYLLHLPVWLCLF